MRKILSIFAAALVAIAVNAQTDFDGGYNCTADAAVLVGTTGSSFGLNTDAEPHYVFWSDRALSNPAAATWEVQSSLACYVSVSLDLGPVVGSNKHIFEVRVYDANGTELGMVKEAGENTDSEKVKPLDGTILIPGAGTYTVELVNNRDWGKGAVKNVILTYAGSAPVTDFAAPGYSCTADDAVLEGTTGSSFGLNTDADPHYIFWSDRALSNPAAATWSVMATRGCYVSVTLDLGPVVGSNKHIFEVSVKNAKGVELGVVKEAGENTDSEMQKVLDGTILLPAAGSYTVELINNRDWGKGSIKNVVLTYAADAPTEIIEVTSVTINKTELALDIEEVEQLSAVVSPEDATDPTVTWESSVPAVATVSEEGFVTAIAEGQTVISAKAGDITATCLVSVSAASIPDVDFYAPCVLSAKKAQTEGAIWKMYTNDAYKLYGEGGHNKNYGNALWTINVTRPCIVSGMLNGVEGGHLFELDLYKGEELVATIAHPESKAWSKGEIALEGTLTFATAGNYTLKLRNTQEWSSGKVAGITLTYEADAPAPAHTYTVAGDNTVLFGTAWAPANTDNDMFLQEDNTYKWEKTDLKLAAGTIKFKVVEDHSWDNPAYPANDYELAIPESGIYTIAIYYNPNDNNYVGAVATKTGEAVVVPTIAMHGNFSGDWKDTQEFDIAEGDATASLTLTIAAGNYEFGMRIGGPGNWTANGVSFSRENPSAEVVSGSGNLKLAADQAGDYIFTWTYATNTLTITFPTATAIENTNAAVKAVKRIENGQMIIIKNGVKFNAIGTVVK